MLAWLYVLDAYEGGLPSARYLGVMADAAEIAGRPADYVRDLRTRNSRNVGPGTPGRSGLATGAAARRASTRFVSTRTPTAQRALVEIEASAGGCRAAVPTPDQTPSRAIAPGTSSRYHEKSSPPPDCGVSDSASGPDRADRVLEHARRHLVVDDRRHAAR